MDWIILTCCEIDRSSLLCDDVLLCQENYIVLVGGDRMFGIDTFFRVNTSHRRRISSSSRIIQTLSSAPAASQRLRQQLSTSLCAHSNKSKTRKKNKKKKNSTPLSAHHSHQPRIPPTLSALKPLFVLKISLSHQLQLAEDRHFDSFSGINTSFQHFSSLTYHLIIPCNPTISIHPSFPTPSQHLHQESPLPTPPNLT